MLLGLRLLPFPKMKSLSRVWLFAILWTVAHQAPPSRGFSRQEYWSRLPFASPGDLPDTGIKPRSSALQADALTSEPKNPYKGYKIGIKYLISNSAKNDKHPLSK